MLEPTLAITLAFAFLALMVIFAGVKVVPQGREWTVERFGRFTKVIKPGLTIIVPFFDRIGRKLSVMEEVLPVPSQVVITRDNATVTADAIAFYQVVDTAKAAYEVANLQAGITNLCLTNARTVIGALDLTKCSPSATRSTSVCSPWWMRRQGRGA